MSDNSNLGADCQSAVESQQTGTIYLLTCTVTGKQYVGKTKRKLGRRITEHKRDSSRNRPGIDHAIFVHGWENFTVEVLETCPVEKLDEREIFWIRELNTKAPHGYNLTDGGDGGRGCSPSAETREKISAKMKGRPAHNKGVKHTPEARKRMSEAQKAIGNRPPNHKGKKRKPETCEKISAHHKAAGIKPPSFSGRKHSAESKKKMSTSHKGHPSPNKGVSPSAETRAKISEANKGKGRPHTPETKAKISAAKKGKPSPLKGKPLSPETRQKLSDALKAAWARRKKALENGGGK